MNAILRAGCPAPPPTPPPCACARLTAGRAATRPITANTVAARAITTPPRESDRSEEVAQLEVQFEARIGMPEDIGLVEAVCEVDADRSQWRGDAHADTRAPEQPGRVELRSSGPHVAAVA